MNSYVKIKKKFYKGDRVMFRHDAIPNCINPPPGTIGIVITHKKCGDGQLLEVQWPVDTVHPPKELVNRMNRYNCYSSKVIRVNTKGEEIL